MNKHVRILVIKSVLTAICFMFFVFSHAANDSIQNMSDTISVDKLVKRNGRWSHFKCFIILPTQSSGLDNFWCEIMKKGVEFDAKQNEVASAQTLKEYVNSQLGTYEEVKAYTQRRFKALSSKGEVVDIDQIQIVPKGKALGSIQMYGIKKYHKTSSERTSFELGIVYDKIKDKVLAVDDIFVPKTAKEIKKDFGEFFININVSHQGVSCGYVENERPVVFNGHSYSYIGSDSVLTDDFKQSVNFSEIVENIKMEKERFAKEMQMYAKKKEIEKENEVYEYVHVMPKLGLKKKELQEFLIKNFHWTDSIEMDNRKGRFSVSYIVEKDGSISNVHMTDTTFANSPIEKEMERVIKLLPSCTPGLYNNEKVRVRVSHDFSYNQKSSFVIKSGSLVDKTIYERDKTIYERFFKTANIITNIIRGRYLYWEWR